MRAKPRLIIANHFGSVKDPRTDNAVRHQLLDILVIAICAVICGADTWVEVEQWGQAQQTWLKTFLALPNGIPAHDTFGRMFAQPDPQQFRMGSVSDRDNRCSKSAAFDSLHVSGASLRVANQMALFDELCIAPRPTRRC